jgi:hypothetical protein
MTSPVRISERFRDSSNRSAKDSDIYGSFRQAGLAGALATLHATALDLETAVGCGRKPGWLNNQKAGALSREGSLLER